jgi:hypothetical protein
MDWKKDWLFREMVAARQINLDGTIRQRPHRPHPKKKDHITYGKALDSTG